MSKNELKICRICNEQKSVSEFYKDKERIRTECKICTRNRNNQYRLSSCDRKVKVYYLPEEHYIGITELNISERMSKHRYSGKITEGYEVIATFERHVDAAWLEIMFHQRGYNGYNNINRRNAKRLSKH